MCGTHLCLWSPWLSCLFTSLFCFNNSFATCLLYAASLLLSSLSYVRWHNHQQMLFPGEKYVDNKGPICICAICTTWWQKKLNVDDRGKTRDVEAERALDGSEFRKASENLSLTAEKAHVKARAHKQLKTVTTTSLMSIKTGIEWLECGCATFLPKGTSTDGSAGVFLP